jgi:hypothetical protein
VVILHLWQAVQLVIDLALSACSDLRLGTPASYADAFTRLASAGKLDAELARRLARAAGLRNPHGSRLRLDRPRPAPRSGVERPARSAGVSRGAQRPDVGESLAPRQNCIRTVLWNPNLVALERRIER